MGHLLLHDMDSVWSSSDATLIQVAADASVAAEPGGTSNQLVGQDGTTGVAVAHVPASPVDLSPYDELRFWIRADRAAAGTARSPFFLDFGFVDQTSGSAVEHRWLVPVNRSGRWEHRRVGIVAEARSQVQSFDFRSLTDSPFSCHIDELLAVRDEPLADAEAALVRQLERLATIPGLTDVAVAQPSSGSSVTVAINLGFHPGNRIRIHPGGDEIDVVGVSHDAGAGRTTLQLATPLPGPLTPGTATLSVLVPVLVDSPPTPLPTVTPAIVATHLDAREDLGRSSGITQRDSFRRVGPTTVCSVRAAARALASDYQILTRAPERSQQLVLHEAILRELSLERSIRICGSPSPVWILPPPVLEDRAPGVNAPVYVRIGTRIETEPRRQVNFPDRADIEAGHLDQPTDREAIVLDL